MRKEFLTAAALLLSAQFAQAAGTPWTERAHQIDILQQRRDTLSNAIGDSWVKQRPSIDPMSPYDCELGLVNFLDHLQLRPLEVTLEIAAKMKDPDDESAVSEILAEQADNFQETMQDSEIFLEASMISCRGNAGFVADYAEVRTFDHDVLAALFTLAGPRAGHPRDGL